MANNPFRQIPTDVAVVIPTILRPSLTRAVRSIFAQDLDGRIQVLIGIDAVKGDLSQIDALRQECPEHIELDVLDLGYSTNAINGGLYRCVYGGALRTILSFQANSRYLAYLDDDNWWAPDHLSSLLATVQGVDWAYSQRWMVDPRTLASVCIDDWESVGPDKGMFAKDFGGFVDTNTLLLDKLACPEILYLWSQTMFANRLDGEDRLIFNALRKSYRGRPSEAATAFYICRETDQLDPVRRAYFRRHGHEWNAPARAEPVALLPDPALARSRLLAGLLKAVRRREREGDMPAALSLIERLLAFAPGDRAIMRQMGRLCGALGQAGDARAIFEGLLAEDPTDAETRAEIAMLDAALVSRSA
jgi:hypothetical protein